METNSVKLDGFGAELSPAAQVLIQRANLMLHLARGGRVEHRSRETAVPWEEVEADHDFSFDIYDYRMLKTRQDSIAWSHLDPRYRWVARDANGRAYAYAKRPSPEGVYQHWHTDDCVFVRVDEVLASYKPGNLPWHKSLIERPGDA